jgi:hypothetical protein
MASLTLVSRPPETEKRQTSPSCRGKSAALKLTGPGRGVGEGVGEGVGVGVAVGLAVGAGVVGRVTAMLARFWPRSTESVPPDSESDP